MRRQSLEAQLQEACVRWFTYSYQQYEKLFFAVPNGGSRNQIEAYNLKLQGVTPGVSDLILLVPNKTYHALCIEMKHGKGKQTEHQIMFQNSVEAAGYQYTVCRTFEEFETTIKTYLSNL